MRISRNKIGDAEAEILSPQLEIECSWMREAHIDWIVQAPACVVLIINLIFLIKIMWVSLWHCAITPCPRFISSFGRHVLLIICYIYTYSHYSTYANISSYLFSNRKHSLALFSGTYHKTSFGKHRGNAAVSQGIQSPSRTYSSSRHNIFDCDLWARGWERRKTDIQCDKIVITEHTGKQILRLF
jgi:hypothetical protein